MMIYINSNSQLQDKILCYLDMQSAKPAINYKYNNYHVQLFVHGEQKLSINVIDNLQRLEYQEKEVILQSIGTNTLIKGLQQSKKQIKVELTKKNMAENDLLEVKVTVQSPFLKPVVEVILLKKSREVSEQETIRMALSHLSKKIKDLKESKDCNKLSTYYGATLEQKSYSATTYEQIASIKLPKGKYLLTFNFLLKATNSWIYLYLNQGQSLMANSGFYVPSANHFIPYTVRKIHCVNNESQNISFTTYYAQSYPVTIRNAIITAKPLPE